jgi:serine/threonine protein phosphatase PrpC
MKYKVAQQTYIGGRNNNEDRIIVIERKNEILMAVADGLGGHPGGDVASQAMVDALAHSFHNTSSSQLTDPSAFLALSFGYAHTMIRRRAQENDLPPHAPRTTCIACVIKGKHAYWAHIGDSRLYFIRNGKELIKTTDHASDASADKEHPFLSRCIGGHERPHATLGPRIRMKDGDVIMLCSDGVWKNMKLEDIVQGSHDPHPQIYLDKLLRRLEKRNTAPSDNLSSILFQWRSPGREKEEKSQLSESVRQDLQSALEMPRVTEQTEDVDAAVPADQIEDVIAEIESFIERMDDKI